MRNAAKFLIFSLCAATLVACHKAQPTASTNQDITLDENGTTELPRNAQIETLPPDESSMTPSNQLQQGYDNPDVNDVGNSD